MSKDSMAAAADRTEPEQDLYPASPSPLPTLEMVTAAYRLRVLLVLLSLFLFLILYVGLVVGSGYLIHLSLEMPWPRGRGGIVKLGAIAGSTLLFLFLLKGLFKRSRIDESGLVEVRESEQPLLFDFVRRLCGEAGSRLPGKIHLTHDVNAAVTYPRSLLTLFWPVRKNLLIGLGLVNVLNLSEFKAVLAHEFGHFAQSSMKLGQYVYVANQVIYDMVFARDYWDELIRQWKRIDLRVSFPAWILSFIVWALRHMLGLVFRGINLLNLSLSRQMEFNADLQAVRLCGSDALISGLWKIERGSIAFNMACSDLGSLAEHKQYSDDFFFHQSGALARLDELLQRDQGSRADIRHLARAYVPGPELHFPDSEEHGAPMWQTHPSTHLREKNAKKTYIGCKQDPRSAFVLFDSQGELRKALTLQAYRQLLGVLPWEHQLSPAREIEEKVKEEREEVRQAEHYHGLFDDRALSPGKPAELIQELEGELQGNKTDLSGLRQEAAAWTGDNLKRRMDAVRRISEEVSLLAGLHSGALQLKGRTFKFRGEDLEKAAVEPTLRRVTEEQKALHEELSKADRAFFRYFWHASAEERAGSRAIREELLARYEFLLAVQDLIRDLNHVEDRTGPVLEYLQQGKELSSEDFQYVRATFGQGHETLEKVIQECERLIVPELSHMQKGSSLGAFVLQEALVPKPAEGSIAGEWIGKYLAQFQQVLGRLRKLHFKNLGHLLKLQEKLDPTLFAGAQKAEQVP